MRPGGSSWHHMISGFRGQANCRISGRTMGQRAPERTQACPGPSLKAPCPTPCLPGCDRGAHPQEAQFSIDWTPQGSMNVVMGEGPNREESPCSLQRAPRPLQGRQTGGLAQKSQAPILEKGGLGIKRRPEASSPRGQVDSSSWTGGR